MHQLLAVLLRLRNLNVTIAKLSKLYQRPLSIFLRSMLNDFLFSIRILAERFSFLQNVLTEFVRVDDWNINKQSARNDLSDGMNVLLDSLYNKSICSSDRPLVSGMKKYVKTRHPTQVPPQMKNTFTPRLAALIPSGPKVVWLTR